MWILEVNQIHNEMRCNMRKKETEAMYIRRSSHELTEEEQAAVIKDYATAKGYKVIEKPTDQQRAGKNADW